MNYYQVGKIINTHGIRGEVRVLSTSDFTDERFMPGNALYLFDKGALVKEVVVKTHRKHKQFDLLSFEKLEDINLIEGFKGFDIKISEDQQQDLEDGSYYYHQILMRSLWTAKKLAKSVKSLPLVPMTCGSLIEKAKRNCCCL